MREKHTREKIFYNSDAMSLLHKYYPSSGVDRKLVKTIHKAGHDESQIDSILYSLVGSPAKGTLMISMSDNKIKSIRVFNSWGKLLGRYTRYNDYKII